MSKTLRVVRKMPFIVSALVLAGAGVFHLFFYNHQLAYVRARNARLLAVPERSLTTTVRADGSDLERQVSRQGGLLTVTARRTSAEAPPEWRGVAATFSVAMRDILLQVPLGQEAFDLVLVTDDTGQVIEQVGDATLVRQTLDGITSADGKAVEVKSLWGATRTVPTRLNGREYAMFCHPVVLGHEVTDGRRTGGDPRQGFIFCGLASSDRLRRQALCISPTIVAGLVAVLALTLLTPPFIKLFLLGRRERLRFTDVYSLAFCALVGLLILSVVVLDAALFASLHLHADRALQDLAGQVQRNLDDELRRVRSQLAAFDYDLTTGRGDGACHNIFGLHDTSATGCPALSAGRLSYPFFENVGWSGTDGEQTVRWSTLPKPGRRFFVGTRDYFTAVRDNHLWTLPARPESVPESGPFYVQALRSWSTGQTRAVLSMPSARNAQLVAALTTRLISLTDPVLPPRVGFAVVDPTGEVLFHSDSRLSLTHNLFAESGEDLELRSAVAARASEFTHGRYWGQSHQFYTTPVPGTPWTVVAFGKEDLLRAANVEILENATALVLLYTLLSYAVPSLLYLLFMRRRLGWLWPSLERRVVYAELVVTLTMVGALFLALLRHAQPHQAVALAFTVPWGTLAAVVVAFHGSPFAYLIQKAPTAWRTRIDRACRSRFWVLHLGASALFWALYAPLPAMAIMKAVAEAELQSLARHEQRWLDDRMDQRSRAAEVFFGERLNRTAKADVELRAARRAETLDVYQAGLFRAPQDPRLDPALGPAWLGAFADGQESSPGLLRWLRELLEAAHTHKPLLDRAAASLRHLSGTEAFRGAWRRGPDGGHEFVLRDERGRVDPFRKLVGPWPSFWSAVGPWPLLPALLLTVVIVHWIRWCTRKLFLAEVTRPEAHSLESLKKEIHGHNLCLVPSSFEIDRLLEGGWCERLSFLDEATKSLGLDKSRPLLVDGRGFEAAEVERRQAVLDYIEDRISCGDQRVCILTSRHPADLLFGPPAGTPVPAWPPGELDRWLRLFDQFSPVLLRERRLSDSGDFDESLEAAGRLLESRAQPARVRRLAVELASTPHLARLTDRHLARGAFASVGHAEMLGRLAELAESYYWGLWNACSQEEKLTLVQLSEETFVNPRRVGSVKKLMDRGLVLRDPVLRPMNESFSLFIRAIPCHEQVSSWEKAEGGISWSDLQLPLVTVASVCGFLLFLSHQDLLDSTVPLVSALGATGVPLLARLAGSFKSLAESRLARGGDPA